MSADTVTAFTFETLPVRGALVQLTASWQRMQRDHDYSELLMQTLGHASAASTLIAQSLKFDGAITMQLQGGNALKMLVVQCTSELDLRGMASAKPNSDADSFSQLTAGSHCAITVDNGERPYQGIVAVDEASLSASLKNYFDRSVQVPSHIALVADETVAAGILLQQMPGEAIADDDWARLGFLAETLSLADFEADAGIDLLAKLFAEDDVRVFHSKRVSFQCRCSEKKAADVIRMLGVDESRQTVEEHGELEIICEYCGERRRFDKVDIEKLFSENVVRGPGSVQ